MKVTDVAVAKKMLSIASSAADRGIPFDISFKKMKRLMEQERCYYTGVRFDESGPNMRSIDRVDNERGYIDDNVVACTVFINGKKKDLTIGEIQAIFRKVTMFLSR